MGDSEITVSKKTWKQIRKGAKKKNAGGGRYKPKPSLDELNAAWTRFADELEKEFIQSIKNDPAEGENYEF